MSFILNFIIMLENVEQIIKLLSTICTINVSSVKAVVKLLDEGATVPFISRYRKEATGSMDEVQVGAIKLHLEKTRDLFARKESILSTIEQQGRLTDELKTKIERCFDSVQLEDIYLPYKPKRRTRAMIACEKGLEPLASLVMSQDGQKPEQLAKRFINDAVPTPEEALGGVNDIIAEWVSESERARNVVRRLFKNEANISTKVVKGKAEEGVKYSDYFECQEPFKRISSHRLLAMIRAEREGYIRLNIAPDSERAVEQLERIFVKGNSPSRSVIEGAIKDSYKRLLKPSIENEALAVAKECADEAAIAIFAENLRQLLLSAPLGQKRLLAIDPGFRTGCKVVCLNEQGDLLHNTTIYPHAPQNQSEKASADLNSLISKFKIDAIAIGDGTAGRETEQLVKSLVHSESLDIFMVSEDGASIYSASDVAREEFPDYDITVRGSVSIGRRLIDPLAELVKIDPKSIGVGQYQHDVDQGRLKSALDTVVESCVNGVGVNLNTASKQLLSYVSGVGASLAKNIVEYRAINGSFTRRSQLLKVPRLGAKAYEQCAGFLRIENAKNPLDNSAVHPEAYSIVEKIAKDIKVTISELINNKEVITKIDLSKYVTDKIGIPTLTDIVSELEKPGRDPRGVKESFSFAESVRTIDDLYEGMVVPGIVTNMTAFGAFVDIGIKQDGLVHISQIANKFITAPSEVLKLHEQVEVKVIGIDKVRGRLSLSIKEV